MRTLSQKTLIVVLSMAGFVAACRSNDTTFTQPDAPPRMADPAPSGTSHAFSNSNGGGGASMETNDGGATASSSDTSSSTSASSSSSGMAPYPGNPEYVTDLLVYAGCNEDGADVPVANGHPNPTDCEHIVITPAHNDDGDFYEVAATFNWTSTDSATLPVSCLNGVHDNFCWPVGQADLFDTGQLNEPSAAITACAVNDCPIPRPADCLDQICVSFTAESVINIEGEWSPTGDTFDDRDLLILSQDGRSFEDQLFGVKRGEINAWSLRFEVDDYLYTGGFIDRDHIQGDVEDSIGGNYIGSWSAERTTL